MKQEEINSMTEVVNTFDRILGEMNNAWKDIVDAFSVRESEVLDLTVLTPDSSMTQNNNSESN